jgi:hypothetical protein
MPDVRHGCAAQCSALTASRHNHSASRAGPSPALSLAVEASQRCPLTSRAPFVVTHSPARFPRLPPMHRRAFSTVDGSPTLARRSHRAIAARASGPRRRVGSPRLRHGRSVRAASRHAARLAMPRLTPPAVSGSTPPHQRIGVPAQGPTRVLRPLRSSSTRPASIRPCLTPACSGLASLVADARR